jgi:hypothetical protein
VVVFIEVPRAVVADDAVTAGEVAAASGVVTEVGRTVVTVSDYLALLNKFF